MRRNINRVKEKKFDLLIIGGGIVGAVSAWDAALRGLSVALVEKNDFGSATSAASGKMIHGGIRYMQHADLRRVRKSLRNRMEFQKIAPHLVTPIPFLIPTYGHGMKGKEILTAGMIAYELMGLDTNSSDDPAKQIPRFKILSREKTLELEPNINRDGLTGAILYYDCQMHTPERLTLSFIKSASLAGAEVLNYTEAVKILVNHDTAEGAEVLDKISGERFIILADIIVNSAGPWVNNLLVKTKEKAAINNLKFSKGIHIVTKPLTKNLGIALSTQNQHAKAILSRGGRHYFIIPWKGHSLIGTTNVEFNGSQDEKMITKKDILDFLDEIKDSYQPLRGININDINYYYGGLYIDDSAQSGGYQGHRSDKIFDHAGEIENLISVIGVKYTTSLDLARKVINIVEKKLGRKISISKMEEKNLIGGDIKRFDDFRKTAFSDYPYLDEEMIKNLIDNYGTQFTEVIKSAGSNSNYLKKIDIDFPFIFAEIIYAAENEMAVKLSDIIFRRMGIGTLGKPKNETLESIAQLMGEKLGWDSDRISSEKNEVLNYYILPEN